MTDWISVNDRLPTEEDQSENGLVLLRVDRKDEIPTYDIGLWEEYDHRWVHRLSRRYECTVTHWMPLPEPPK